MTIQPMRIRIAFVFNTLYYPFTYPEILASLSNRGYIINTEPPLPLPTGQRVYVGGHIASKKGCFIEVNDDRKLLASEGVSIDNVIASARDVIDIAKEDFKLNVERDINFCELASSFAMAEGDRPLEAIRRFSGDSYKIFNDILGAETAGSSIRIIPKNGYPSNKKWFDITITPRFLIEDNEYYIDIIYRDEKNIDGVLEFTSQLPDKMNEIIKRIGGL